MPRYLIRLVTPLPLVDPNVVWLASFDVHARDGLGDVVFTADPAEALEFLDLEACHAAVASRPSPALPPPLSRFHVGAVEISGQLAARIDEVRKGR